MRTKLRSRLMLLFMSLAMVVAIPAVALAAELVTAELAGAPNRVTVVQGKDANFDINLKAEGAMSCEITSARPSKAKVINSYSITKTSAADSDATKRVLPGANYSAEQNFWNDGSDCAKNNNSPITWTGAPKGYDVPASISVAPDVPVGTYTIGLSPANSTSQITNPTVSKGASLEDKHLTALTFEVVAPPPPSDTTTPVITPNIQGTLGDNGWYTSDVGLSWTVVDNESAISSKSGCDNVSITSDQNATIYKCTATSGGGTSSEQVTIKRDATAPVISGEDVNNTTWRNSNLSQSFTSSDAMSGFSNSADGSFTLTASDESGSASTPTMVSKTVKDAAGNSATRSLSALIDKTAPTIADNGPTTNANANGWYKTDVTNRFSASDALSGLANAADTNMAKTTQGEGSAVKVSSGTVTDVAGNVAANIDSAGFQIDKTAPQISGEDVNNTTWRNTDLSANFTASDALSGLANNAADASFTLTTSGQSPNANTPVSASRTVSDLAGNSTPRTISALVDKTAPTLNPSVSPNSVLLNGSATASAGANDVLSGIATTSCGSVDTSSVGSGKSVSCSATDNAGNSDQANANYKVVYGGGGILQPINADGSSRFKLGSTVPVKFQLKDATGSLVSNAIASLNVKKADNTPDAGTDEAISTAASTTGNLFRYDATSGQYIFNLSTKSGYTNSNGTTVSFAQGTYTLSIMLNDGTYRNINIQIVK